MWLYSNIAIGVSNNANYFIVQLLIKVFFSYHLAYTTITSLLTLVLCDPRDDANIDNILGGEEGKHFRNAMFSNKRYADNMRILLPWLNNRGAFDV